jgi:hypothetical protein
VGLAAAERSRWGRLAWLIAAAGYVVVLIAYYAIYAFHNPVSPPDNVHWLRGVLAGATLTMWVTAFTASIFTWRSRALGRWSSAPFFLQLWPFISSILSVIAIDHLISFNSQATMAQLTLIMLLLQLPTWGLTVATGIGLLRVSKLQALLSAAQPSDAVQ